MSPLFVALVFLVAGDVPGDPSRALVAVPLPVTSEADPAVAQALADTAEIVRRTLAEPAAPPAALAAAFGRLGLVAQAHEFLATARAAYGNALVLLPGLPLWTYALGMTEAALGDLEAAAGRYRAVLERVPADGPARFRLGELLRQLGRTDEAERELRLCLESPTVRTAALAALGQLAFDLGRDREAVEWLERALAAEPRATRLHYPLALAYRRLGDVAAAERHLALRGEAGVAPGDPLVAQLSELAAGEDIALLRARLAFQAEDFEGALRWFERARERAPANAAARIGRAAALAGLGRTREAVEELDAVLAANPAQATARFNRATLAFTAGDLAAAELHFARYLEIQPEDREARLALGEVLLRRGSPGAALEQFGEVLRRSPDGGPEGLLGRARALAVLGRMPEAAADLREAERRWPLDPRVRATAAELPSAVREPLP